MLRTCNIMSPLVAPSHPDVAMWMFIVFLRLQYCCCGRKETEVHVMAPSLLGSTEACYPLDTPCGRTWAVCVFTSGNSCSQHDSKVSPLRKVSSFWMTNPVFTFQWKILVPVLQGSYGVVESFSDLLQDLRVLWITSCFIKTSLQIQIQIETRIYRRFNGLHHISGDMKKKCFSQTFCYKRSPWSRVLFEKLIVT